MAEVQEAPPSSGLTPALTRVMLAMQHRISPVWAFLTDRLSPLLVLFYQGVVLIAFIIIPLLAYRWHQVPFLGIFVEQTLVVSGISPTRTGTRELRSANLEFGDRITAINSQPVGDSRDLHSVLGTYASGDTIPVTLTSPGGASQTVLVTLGSLPGLDLFANLFLPYFIGLVYLVSSLLVFRLRRGDQAGRAFAVFTASVAFVVAGSFDVFTTHRLTYLWTLALALAGGSLFSLAMFFPKAIRLVSRWPSLGWAGYLPAFGLVIFAFSKLYDLSEPLAYTLAWRGEFVYLGLAGAFYTGWLARRYLSSASPIVHEQARLLLWGALIAFGPLAVWFVGSLFYPGLRFSGLLPLPLIVFPILSAYTILHYRLSSVDYILSRTTQYSMLSVLIVAGYALMVSGMSLLFGELLPSNNPILLGPVLLILALAFNPLRQQLEKLVDHAFFRGEEVYREHLQVFSHELTQALDLPSILDLLRQYVFKALLPQSLHIFVYQTAGEYYAAVPDESGDTTSDIRFEAESALASTLSARHAALFLGEQITVPVRLQPEGVRLAMLGATLFVPLPGRNRLTGWLALGPRRSGVAYSRQDLTYLESLGDQVALAIERAQVVADLERRVHEMDVLTRVAEGINVTLAFEDILELISAQTNLLLPTKDLQIALLDERGKRLYFAFYVEKDERLPEKEHKNSSGVGVLIEEVVRSSQAVVVENYERECLSRGALSNVEGVYAWMGVPLNAGAQTIGAIGLGSRDPLVRYSPAQVELLQAIADLAAGAIVKARLLDETNQRAQQMATLNEVARSLTSTLEMDPDLLRRILQSAVDILDCEAGSLLMVDEQSGELVFEVALGPVGDELVGTRLPPGAGLAGKAVESGEAIIQNDARRSSEWFDTDSQTGYSTEDLLVVPLQVTDKVIGVLEVLNKQDRSPFTTDDQEILRAFAGQAAVVIENARLYTLTDQALAARVEELSMMQRIDRELNASLDVARAMRLTLEWSLRQSGAQAGLVGIVEQESIRVMASHGYPAKLEEGVRVVLSTELPPFAEAIKTGQVQSQQVAVNEQTQASAHTSLLAGARSQILVPIRWEGQVIGVLLLENEAPAMPSEDTLAFLSRLSDHAAIAIANAQLYAEVQAASLAKSQFVSAAAHELKNPLTSIKGYSDLIVQGAVGPINEAQTNFLSTIRANAERMSTLVTDLQDLSRIEANQLPMEFGVVPLAVVIDEVVRSFTSQIESKDQSLVLDLPEDLPPVWGDRIRQGQILTNLVSNAHKYTPESGRITLSAREVPNQWDPQGPPQVVLVTVQDSGIGIGPGDQKKIFQQFFRSDDPKVREVTGTGLGLSITRNLVEMQGGKIWFESELNHGTTFYFTAPLAEVT